MAVAAATVASVVSAGTAALVLPVVRARGRSPVPGAPGVAGRTRVWVVWLAPAVLLAGSAGTPVWLGRPVGSRPAVVTAVLVVAVVWRSMPVSPGAPVAPVVPGALTVTAGAAVTAATGRRVRRVRRPPRRAAPAALVRPVVLVVPVVPGVPEGHRPVMGVPVAPGVWVPPAGPAGPARMVPMARRG